MHSQGQLLAPGLLLAEMSCNRARNHSRVGSIGISVKKKNVLLALSSGLLHGLYKDRDELTENKETRGGENQGQVGGVTALRNAWLLLMPKNNTELFSPNSS